MEQFTSRLRSTLFQPSVRLMIYGARYKVIVSVESSIHFSFSGSIEVWELSVEKDSIGCVGRAVEHDSIVSTVSVNSDVSKFVSADYGGW